MTCRSFCFIVLALCAFAPAAGAQTVDQWSAVQQLQADIKADRQAVVTLNLPLTEAEAKAFWPIYKEYRTEMERLSDRTVKLIAAYAANFTLMNDERATAFFNEWLAIERERSGIRDKYVPRFRGVLPARKPRGTSRSRTNWTPSSTCSWRPRSRWCRPSASIGAC